MDYTELIEIIAGFVVAVLSFFFGKKRGKNSVK